MDNCPCLPARVTISGNQITARVSSTGNTNGTVSVGNIIIKDGTNNYETLNNKPSIEGATLTGDKTFDELGLEPMSFHEIDEILYG